MSDSKTQEGLNNILDAINNVVDGKIQTLKFDKTFRAKVTEKISASSYKVTISGVEYTLSYPNELNVGDIVHVKSPLNNFSDKYIEGGASAFITGTVPIGAYIPFAGATAPANWLLCDGSAVSRTTYSELFAAIGTTYGEGDGSTTFNLPNLSGKIPVGIDSTQTEFNTLGETGGEKEQDLRALVGSTDSMSQRIGYKAAEAVPKKHYSEYTYAIDGSLTTDRTDINHSTPVYRGVDGEYPSTLQPYIVSNYIIKVKESSGTLAEVQNVYNTSASNTYSCNYLNTKLEGVILYSNDTGTTGDITLNASLDDGDIIEIEYIMFGVSTNEFYKKSTGRITYSNNCFIQLDMNYHSSGTTTQMISKSVKLSENELTVVSETTISITGLNIGEHEESTTIYITKVVKY